MTQLSSSRRNHSYFYLNSCFTLNSDNGPMSVNNLSTAAAPRRLRSQGRVSPARCSQVMRGWGRAAAGTAAAGAPRSGWEAPQVVAVAVPSLSWWPERRWGSLEKESATGEDGLVMKELLTQIKDKGSKHCVRRKTLAETARGAELTAGQKSFPQNWKKELVSFLASP